MNITVEIGKKGTGKSIGPKDRAPHTSGNRTQVKKGDVVTFTIPGAANNPRPVLKFRGPSPFAGEVTYNTPLAIVATATPTIFKYDCQAVIDGEAFSSDSGGEMVIIPG